LKPRAQLRFPVPSVFSQREHETVADFHERVLLDYEAFLRSHGDEIGVLLVEPQWGSSVAAQPWPPKLLRKYISKAQACGILVCCDEIMCGLGRHGQGPSLFLSDAKAWNLCPDAVTFGKAIAGGIYPMSGAIIRRGAEALGAQGRSVLQSHTYSGASTRALMAGQATLDLVPSFFEHVKSMGRALDVIFSGLETLSDGVLRCHGTGMMWGALFQYDTVQKRRHATAIMKKNCAGEGGVWPYFVPAGGFMISPPLDTPEKDLQEMGRRLSQALTATLQELHS